MAHGRNRGIQLRTGMVSALRGARRRNTYTQRGEEPPVLAALVALLKELLDRLLRLLALLHLLEGVVAHNTLKTLELKRVAGREQVVVVDHLVQSASLPDNHTPPHVP